MSGKRMFRLAFATLFIAIGFASFAEAAPPWSNLITKASGGDAEGSYAISEANGPWMIVACSFSGEGAEKQAQGLAEELRRKYKLPAYVHEMSFNLKEAQGRGVDRFGAPVKMKYRSGDSIKEVAVLVGNYASVDDSEAQKVLKKLKYAEPDCLKTKDGRSTNQSLAGWREIQKTLQDQINSSKKEKGPMGHAFVTTNPLLPAERFTGDLDPLVVEINKDVPHSLLNCTGKYTVQVATFKGQVIIDQKEIAAIQSGKKKMNSSLDAAALKAHELTEALRMKGYDAYEFHDRYASIVTVGSFESVGTPMPDGRIEINPKIHAIMRTFSAQPVDVPTDGKNALPTAVKSLAGINFDIQPIPVQVPKRPISATLNRSVATNGMQ